MLPSSSVLSTRLGRLRLTRQASEPLKNADAASNAASSASFHTELARTSTQPIAASRQGAAATHGGQADRRVGRDRPAICALGQIWPCSRPPPRRGSVGAPSPTPP